jgi:hypothetical protein
MSQVGNIGEGAQSFGSSVAPVTDRKEPMRESYGEAVASQTGPIYDTRPCLIIENVIPDAPTGAFVMAGWGNDTSVVNCYNVDYTVVEVTLPASTKAYDTVEVKLSDGIHESLGTASGGETTVYVTVDCTGLSDGDLTLTARAYNAAGSSSTTDGTDAVKDATAPTIVVEEPEDDIVVELSYVTVKGTCPDGDLASFTIGGEATPREGGGAFQKTLFLTSGQWGTYIEVTAEDVHRNATTLTRYVEVAPLEVEITSPADAAVLDATAIRVISLIRGPKDAEVFLNGQRAVRDGESFTLADFPLTEGPNTLTAHAMTPHASADHTITVTRDTTNPVVTIEYPEDGDAFNTASITVTGTVEEANLVSVTVNGVQAELYGGYFVAENVALNTEGENGIIVVATDAVSRTGQAQITVTRDTTPPSVEITSPEDGSTVHTTLPTISGTVEAGVVYLAVNGKVIEPEGESWSTEVLLETEGEHTITVVARDAAANESDDSITVTRNLPPVVKITEVVFSPKSTEEQAKVKITGTVDDADALIACGEVEGTNAAGTFVLDGVNVYSGTNILTVTATDADGQVTSVDAVVDLDPGSGDYELPGQGEGGEAPPPPILTCTPLTVDEGEGGKAAGAGMFMTFGALLDGGPEKPSLKVKDYGTEINVWVATDLHFSVQSGACTGALESATLKIPAAYLGDNKKLTVYASSDRQVSEAGPDTEGNYSYTTGPDPSDGTSFWWDVDATDVCQWQKIKVEVTYKDKTNSKTWPKESNPVRGNNDGVVSLDLEVTKGGELLQSTSDGKYIILFEQDAAYADLKYTAKTALGKLNDKVCWQLDGATQKTTGAELRTTLMSTGTQSVIPWGEAANRNPGDRVGGPGPEANQNPDLGAHRDTGGPAGGQPGGNANGGGDQKGPERGQQAQAGKVSVTIVVEGTSTFPVKSRFKAKVTLNAPTMNAPVKVTIGAIENMGGKAQAKSESVTPTEAELEHAKTKTVTLVTTGVPSKEQDSTRLEATVGEKRWGYSDGFSVVAMELHRPF